MGKEGKERNKKEGTNQVRRAQEKTRTKSKLEPQEKDEQNKHKRMFKRKRHKTIPIFDAKPRQRKRKEKYVEKQAEKRISLYISCFLSGFIFSSGFPPRHCSFFCSTNP